MKTTLALLAALAASAFASPTVKPSAVRVVRETYGDGFNGLTPFNTQRKGTSVALLIETDKGAIIELGTRDSEVGSFTDDKGTDLLAKKDGFNKDGFGPFPRVSKDAKAALVTIEGGGLPADGATSLQVKGSLIVHTASTKKTFKSAPAELKPGAMLTVGTIALKVSKAGKPGFGDAALEVEFESKDAAIEHVAEVKFFDAGGKELASDSSGSGSMGFGGKMTYSVSYTLEKAVAGKVVVQFEQWADVEKSELPIDVTVGLGG